MLFPEGIIGTIERWRRNRVNYTQMLDLQIERILPARSAGKPAAISGGVAIEVQKGRKNFGHVVALADVDFIVPQGEIHGLVGANGSGKTTLLNVLSGMIRLNAGTLTIKNIDITRMSPHRIARLGIGRTFQTPRVFPMLSIWENLEIGLDARDTGTPIPEDVLRELASELGGRNIELVSHGQRRLIEVLRVVMKGADLLLLDEPCAGLSARERQEFASLLRRLRDDFSKTIVLVEHDLELVWDVADTVTVLDAGQIIAQGKPLDVANDPAVRQLFVKAVHA
jgi:branched-chain amino acid transport system permease protein